MRWLKFIMLFSLELFGINSVYCQNFNEIYEKEDYYNKNVLQMASVKTITRYDFFESDSSIAEVSEFSEKGLLNKKTSYFKDGKVESTTKLFYDDLLRLLRRDKIEGMDTNYTIFSYSKHQVKICLDCFRKDSIIILEDYDNSGKLIKRISYLGENITRESTFLYKKNCRIENAINHSGSESNKFTITSLIKDNWLVEVNCNNNSFKIDYFYHHSQEGKVISLTKVFLMSDETAFIIIWTYNEKGLITTEKTFDYLGNKTSESHFVYQYW